MRAAVLVYFVLLGLTEGVWIARIPGVKAGLHLTDGLLGASLLVGPAGLVAVMPLAGRLADQFGSARVSLRRPRSPCCRCSSGRPARFPWS